MLNIIKFIFTLFMLLVSATIIAAVWSDPLLSLGVRLGVTCGMSAIIIYILYLYYKAFKAKRNDK